MNLTLPTKYLRAALICSAKDDIRYYINGVCVEITKNECFIVATNGHILFAARVADAFQTSGKWIIPHKALACLFSVIEDERPADADPDEWESYCPKDVTLNFENSALCSIALDDLTVGFTCIGGTFPDWRKVIPANGSGIAGDFALEYMHDLKKIGRLIGGSYESTPSLSHDGKEKAVKAVWKDPNAIVVLMPLKVKGCPAQPWIEKIIQAREAKAAAEALNQEK